MVKLSPVVHKFFLVLKPIVDRFFWEMTGRKLEEEKMEIR
jgi:hypothetical protein